MFDYREGATIAILEVYENGDMLVNYAKQPLDEPFIIHAEVE